MTRKTYRVVGSENDWTDTVIGPVYDEGYIYATAQGMPNPHVEKVAYAQIDTSGIPDDQAVEAATLYWFTEAYTTRDTNPDSSIWIWDGAGYQLVLSKTEFPEDLDSVAIPEDLLQYISTVGMTKFRFTSALEEGVNREWEIRAWDAHWSRNEQVFIVVDYDYASVYEGTGPSKKLVTGVGATSASTKEVLGTGPSNRVVSGEGETVLSGQVVQGAGPSATVVKGTGESEQ